MDCTIVATTVSLGEGLIAEDAKTLSKRRVLEERYKIKAYSYKDLAV
jgi:hypothetical protein